MSFRYNLGRRRSQRNGELPKDPNPTWLGYSVGRWEGDTFVVETTGFNGKKWLDQGGHPATDALHTTERFRRRDFGHLDIEFTVDDPKAYTKPWTLNLRNCFMRTPSYWSSSATKTKKI